MELSKKVVSLLLIGIYWYNQSVFSHLLVVDLHHETKSIVHDHTHKSGETHKHISKAISLCKDSNCETTCKSIEKAKLTSHQQNKLFGEIEEICGDCFLPINKYHGVTSPKQEFSHFSIITGPPIPIEELIPRIGPVVRII